MASGAKVEASLLRAGSELAKHGQRRERRKVAEQSKVFEIDGPFSKLNCTGLPKRGRPCGPRLSSSFLAVLLVRLGDA